MLVSFENGRDIKFLQNDLEQGFREPGDSPPSDLIKLNPKMYTISLLETKTLDQSKNKFGKCSSN